MRRTAARVAEVGMGGKAGAFLVFFGVGDGVGVSAARSATVQTRTYYIAADEVDWDYAPQGKDMISGEPFTDEENVFVANGDDRIGSTYRKALYREYTDASFSTLKPKDPKWEHTGLLGPIILYADGSLRADGSVAGIDKEFITFYSVMNENQSHYLDYNVEHFTGKPSTVNVDDEDFQESNLMHSINGYVYGNGPMMK